MMEQDKTILEKLKHDEFKLRKSERKVANWIIENADRVTKLNITTIANHIGVSEPTIVRFSRAVGCKGYQEFKIHFAEELAIGKINDTINIQVDDSTETVKDKVAQFARAALTNIDREIDTEQLELATQAHQ